MHSSEARFVDAISMAKDSLSAWKALEDLAGALVGHQLFTVMISDVPAALVRRAYSNRPGEYPTSGTKPLRGNTGDWFDTVFVKRRTFVANTIEDIAKVFPDHELIGSMGLGSVLNLPVVLEGDLVAAINLLAETSHFTPERIAAAEAQLAVPARLCTSLAWHFDGPMENAA
jgi:hypothetical protein